MSDSYPKKCLETLIEEGNVGEVMAEFERLQASVGREQARFQAWAAEQTGVLKKQILEKDATISALIKCVRLLGGD